MEWTPCIKRSYCEPSCDTGSWLTRERLSHYPVRSGSCDNLTTPDQIVLQTHRILYRILLCWCVCLHIFKNPVALETRHWKFWWNIRVDWSLDQFWYIQGESCLTNRSVISVQFNTLKKIQIFCEIKSLIMLSKVTQLLVINTGKWTPILLF